MDILSSVVSSDIFQVILKLLLSSFLAGIIGIERSSMNKPAGFGTHAIIGASSALVVMASQYMALYYDIDASRIPSQILAGIGFIGAGTIIFQKNAVRGLTTAAGVWVTAAIGLTCGAGMYLLAIISTALVLVGMEAFNYVLRLLNKDRNRMGNMETTRKEEQSLSALLEQDTSLPVVLWDERRSSIEAHAILHANGRKEKKHRKNVDAVAASLILEGYLGSRKNN